MAKAPEIRVTNPGGSGQPPKELYSAYDIRLVMHKLGEIGAHTQTLIDKVALNERKLDELEAKVDEVRATLGFARGALWGIGGMIALLLTLAGILVGALAM